MKQESLSPKGKYANTYPFKGTYLSQTATKKAEKQKHSRVLAR
ncbi:hypothetical protein [Microbulbifer sp. SSSA008]